MPARRSLGPLVARKDFGGLASVGLSVELGRAASPAESCQFSVYSPRFPKLTTDNYLLRTPFSRLTPHA
jgi:hypothetical protein